MENDDRPVGRMLSRRQALALFGASAASLAPGALARTGAADPVPVVADCVAQPEQTEGPYFVDKALERSDIRLDPATGKDERGCAAGAAVRLVARERRR